METKQVVNGLKSFKAKVQEQASKVLRNLELEDRRVLEKCWSKSRHEAPLWNEIVNG